MAQFQGKRVSRTWKRVLSQAERDGQKFRLNSGRRTLSEQWALYRQNMSGGRPRPGHPLTAFPNPNAPHIRLGRPDHALDVDTFYGGGESALQAYLQRHEVVVTNPVPGEPWHMEATLGSLLRFAHRIRRWQRRKRK